MYGMTLEDGLEISGIVILVVSLVVLFYKFWPKISKIFISKINLGRTDKVRKLPDKSIQSTRITWEDFVGLTSQQQGQMQQRNITLQQALQNQQLDPFRAEETPRSTVASDLQKLFDQPSNNNTELLQKLNLYYSERDK